MLRKIQSRIHSEKGFTLIELLVVILIIGILAAIALPAFLNQRQKGQDSSAKSGVRTAVTAMETCATDDAGSYSTCDLAKIRGIESSLNNVTLAEPTKTTNSFTVTVTSDSGTTFSIQRASTGTITRQCSAAGSGGCKGGSGQQW